MCPRNCGRKYVQKSSVLRHLKYECGVPKKFKCIICGKDFALKENYRTHMGVRHKIII